MDKVKPLENRRENGVTVIQKSRFDSFLERVFPTVRRLDLYGEPVKIHFGGEDTYKTNVGGVCSIMHILLSAVVVLLAFKRISYPVNSNISNFYQHIDRDAG